VWRCLRDPTFSRFRSRTPRLVTDRQTHDYAVIALAWHRAVKMNTKLINLVDFGQNYNQLIL